MTSGDETAGSGGDARAPGRFGPGGGELKRRLSQELRTAMKARDRLRLGALRMLSSAVTNREVEAGHPLSDDEVVEVAMREVKRRREAIEAFERGGRPERAEDERREMEVLQAYLPQALGHEELEALVEQAVAETGASGPDGFGRVMKLVMGRAKGRADGRTVQELVRRRLG